MPRRLAMPGSISATLRAWKPDAKLQPGCRKQFDDRPVMSIQYVPVCLHERGFFLISGANGLPMNHATLWTLNTCTATAARSKKGTHKIAKFATTL